jgi:hypothetical protein
VKRFVITGTGRSGTKWCATALRCAGVYCGHEQVFATAMMPNHDPPRWGDFEGDSSLAAVPYLIDLPDVIRVLVVRDPFSVVSGFLKAGPFIAGSQPAGMIEYLDQRFPGIRQSKTEAEGALRYWLAWNRTAVQNADVVLRLEDLTVDMLLKAIGREPRWHPYPLGPINQSPSYARGYYEASDIPDYLFREAMEEAANFGYYIPDRGRG